MRIFYSRRIGLDPRTGVTTGSGEKIPVLGGARLYGTTGCWNLGLLSLWTAARGEVPVTGRSVARVRREIGRQSSVGLIGAARAAAGSANLAGGVDAVQRGFQADTGWDARNGNYRVHSGALWVQPRPHRPGVRQLRIMPFGCGWFVTDDTGRRESVDMSTLPPGVLFTSGDYLWTRLRRQSDRVDDPFLIGNRLPVATGEYAFSPDLHLSLFTQFNNADRELFTNLRLAWIPRIGSDVYFVFNEGYDTAGSRRASTGSAALAKVVWRLVIRPGPFMNDPGQGPP